MLDFGFLVQRSTDCSTAACKVRQEQEATIAGCAELLRMCEIGCVFGEFRSPNGLLQRRRSTSSLLLPGVSLGYVAGKRPQPRRSASFAASTLTCDGGSFLEISPNQSSALRAATDDAAASADDEVGGNFAISGDYLQRHGTARKKCCASCKTKKTPYWRDGWEKSVLLCNACGIRYQKYRKYCMTCLSIARKDEKGRLHCPDCLEKL